MARIPESTFSGDAGTVGYDGRKKTGNDFRP